MVDKREQRTDHDMCHSIHSHTHTRTYIHLTDGVCSWGTGDVFTDWKIAVEKFITHIAKTHPDFQGLFFVSGIWGGGGHWWGGNFRRVREHPVSLPSAELEKRVVYTPHVCVFLCVCVPMSV
jgi:hypothetical protein